MGAKDRPDKAPFLFPVKDKVGTENKVVFMVALVVTPKNACCENVRTLFGIVHDCFPGNELFYYLSRFVLPRKTAISSKAKRRH